MNCPKCNSLMEKIEYQSIEIDRCTNCYGLWFDMLEAEHLKAMKGSEQIDIGDPETGEQFNKIEKINCPKCNIQMGKIVDIKQSHIWYETCGICYGLFFDAGEFKDYKEENIFDYFKEIFSKPRQ